MTAERFFEDVAVGDEIEPTTEAPTELQLFLYSAATNNPHRVHYDLPYTKSEGHPALLVHGPLQAALLAKAIRNWAGPRGRLVRFAIQNRGSAYPGELLTYGGTVMGKRQDDAGHHLVDLEIFERKDDGSVIMPGTATVSLPRRQ